MTILFNIIATLATLSLLINGSAVLGQHTNLGAFTSLNSSDQLTNFPTTYNANLNKTIEVGTTSVASITTLANLVTIGTITGGTWQGATIREVYGGTDQTSYSVGDLLYGTSGSNLSKLPIGSNEQVLTASSTGMPEWITPTDTYGIAANIIATSSVNGIATTTENFLSVRVPVASTITNFTCYAKNTGTSTIKATVASDPISAGTNILYITGTRCGSGHVTSTSTFLTTSISAGSYIRIYVSDAEPTGLRPVNLYPNFTLTKND